MVQMGSLLSVGAEQVHKERKRNLLQVLLPLVVVVLEVGKTRINGTVGNVGQETTKQSSVPGLTHGLYGTWRRMGVY